MKKLPFIILLILCQLATFSQPLVINHHHTKIELIPQSAIEAAKAQLHIAYGHTSHGSQLTEGMTGLVDFMNNNGYPLNLYDWSSYAPTTALHLHDYAMNGDVGYYPDWVNNTRAYLGLPNPFTGRGSGIHENVNVIIWSWCGQIGGKYAAGTLDSEYFTPMQQLETDYPGIKFVYMTGHLDHADDAMNKAANQAVRDFCLNNDKVLYDFADIESYNPDQVYFQYANDDCSYYDPFGNYLGNWALEWQATHTEGVDWYSCGSAHTYPLNANQKAYAAWWLWASLAGWDQNISSLPEPSLKKTFRLYPNPCSEHFFVEGFTDQSLRNLQIINVYGQSVQFETTSLTARNLLKISGLKSGVYGVKASAGGHDFTQKLVVR